MRKLGIDLGTTNTCIYHAYCPVGGKSDEFSLVPIKIYYSDDQIGNNFSLPTAYSMPSAIYGVEDIVKGTGYRFYIGEAAIRKAQQDHAVELINTKRLLCYDNPNAEIGYHLTAQDVATMLLRHCCESAKEELGQSFNSAAVCVTQPAAFGVFATTSIERAAMQGGFGKVEPLQEPIAALLSYLYTQLKDEKKAAKLLDDCQKNNNKLLTLVIDIGGGTTDVTIQEISVTGQREPEPRSLTATGYTVTLLNQVRMDTEDGPVATANQEPAFGGLDFDMVIVDHIVKGLNAQFFSKFKKNVILDTTDGKAFLQRLQKRVQDIKQSLADKSYDEVNEVHFEQDGFTMSFGFTKRDIYEWTEPLCYKRTGEKDSERTVYGIISDTISRSGYHIENIDRIFVTGGMSLYEPIRNMLKDKFSSMDQEGKLVFSRNPLEDIAMGAALSDIYFKTNMPPAWLYSDLMLDDPMGMPCVLVQRNTELPMADVKKNFMNLRNPANLYLDVLWGQGPDDYRLKFLRRLKTALPKGKVTALDTPISVEYEIDTHQALSITLIVHDPNGEYRIPVIDLIKELSEINAKEDYNA